MDVKKKFKTVETILPAGELFRIIKLDDGSYKVIQKVAEGNDMETKDFNNDFILIEAEKLSLDDEFMKFEPKTEEEEEAKKLIYEAIKLKVKNFYRPNCDPSFTEDGKGICYVFGKRPAVGKSYDWWHDVAKKYNPERNSRLGTKLQYGAFLGVLIKNLVEEGKNLEWAWNAVCNDSRELGHYWNSENAKHNYETTGSRMICGIYDLANTYKILAEDEDGGGLWLTGGHYRNSGCDRSLADFHHYRYRLYDGYGSIGWIVLD